MGDSRNLKVVIAGDSRGGSTAVRQLGADVDQAGERVKSGGSKFSQFGGVVGSVALGAAAAAVTIAAAFGKMALDVGVSFEKNMNQIQVLGNLTDSQAQDVSARIRGMADEFAKLGFSSDDASSAFVELQKAGMSVDDSFKSLQSTMVLARAGELDMGDAAALLTDQLASFGLKADQAGRVANTMANAANASSIGINDLKFSLSAAGSIAAQTGLSFEDTATAIALLGNNGLKGSDAGTSLKTMLMNLIPQSEKASNAFKSVGVEAYTAEGKFRGFRTVIAELHDGLQKLSPQEQSAALRDMFGSDAARAGAIFGKEGAAGWDKIAGSINLAGAATRMAESNTKGLSGEWNKLVARVKSFAVDAYVAVSPFLASLVAGVNAGLGNIGGLFDRIKAGLASLQTAGGGGGGETGGWIAGIMGFVESARKSFMEILPPAINFFKSVWASIAPALEPVWQRMQEIGQKILVMWTQVSTALGPIMSTLFTVLTWVWELVGPIIVGLVMGFINGVLDLIEGFVNIVTGVFQMFNAALTGNWSLLWEGLKNILTGALQMIWGALNVFWVGKVIKAFEAGWLAIRALFTAGGESALVTVRAWGAALQAFFTGMWTAIKTLFTQGPKAAIAVFRTVLEQGARDVQWYYQEVVKLFTSIPVKIKSVFNGARNWLVTIGKDIVQGLINGIQSMIGAVQSKLSSLTSMIPSWKGPASVDKKLLTGNGQMIIQSLINGFQARTPAVQQYLTGLTGDIQSGVMADRSLATAPAMGGGNVYVTVQGSVTSEGRLIEKIRNGIARKDTRG